MVRLSEENHPDSTADEAAWRRLREPVKKRQQLFRVNIEACMDAFVLASAVHTAAVEHHTAMNVAQRV